MRASRASINGINAVWNNHFNRWKELTNSIISYETLSFIIWTQPPWSGLGRKETNEVETITCPWAARRRVLGGELCAPIGVSHCQWRGQRHGSGHLHRATTRRSVGQRRGQSLRQPVALACEIYWRQAQPQHPSASQRRDGRTPIPQKRQKRNVVCHISWARSLSLCGLQNAHQCARISSPHCRRRHHNRAR